METRDLQGAALGEQLRKSPTDQSKLEKLLEEQARVTFRNVNDGLRAHAAIDGKLVTDTLG